MDSRSTPGTRTDRGLILRHGLIIMNGTGIIDSNYRGGIGFIVYATKDIQINAYDRVGQLVLPNMTPFPFKLVDTLSDTIRGTGGFGHVLHTLLSSKDI